MASRGPIAINPRIDIVFRELFGRPGNEDLLIDLLNDVLGLMRPVVEVTLRNPFQLPDLVDDKLIIVDLEAVDSGGRVYHVEMQTTVDVGIQARVLFTWASIYRRQIQKGDPYQRLMPVISIWFCDRNVVVDSGVGGDTPWHTRWKVRNDAGLVWSDDLELHVVELERWRRRAPGGTGGSDGGHWVRFLAEAEEWVEVPEGLRGPLMEKAMDVLDRFNNDDHARAVYEARVGEERRRLTQELALREALAGRERAEAERERAEAGREDERAGRERAEAEREDQRAGRERAEGEREALVALLRAHGISIQQDEAEEG